MDYISSLFEAILNFLFPRSCISCGDPSSFYCKKCLRTAPDVQSHSLPSWIHTRKEYRDKYFRKAMWRFKYNGDKDIASSFSEILWDSMKEEVSEYSLFGETPLLIPIPTRALRFRERGFSQTDLLCSFISSFAKNTLVYLPNILVYTKEGTPQMKVQTKKERLENMVGAFSILEKEKVRGKHILLIDDIVTTGATLTEARRILLEAGAKSVSAYTIAH